MSSDVWMPPPYKNHRNSTLSRDSNPMGPFYPGSVTALFPDGTSCTVWQEDVTHGYRVARQLNERLSELRPNSPYYVVVDGEGRLFIRLHEPDVERALVRLLSEVPPEILRSPHLRIYAPRRTQVLWLKQHAARRHSSLEFLVSLPTTMLGIGVVQQDAPDDVLLTITAPDFDLFDAKVAGDNLK